MLRILALCLFLALASAFEAPVLSRRAFAKAFAAAPLAAAGAAFAVSASRSHPASRANPSPQRVVTHKNLPRAWQDGDNKYLGTAKAPSESLAFEVKSSGSAGTTGAPGDFAIGRGAFVDASGAAVPLTKSPPGMPSTATYTANEASQLVNGVNKADPGYQSAMARLMAK